MRRGLMAIALTALLAPAATAHEGHEHKVMGTVATIHESHLEVKAVKDGKTSTMTLNEKTKILRGTSPATRDEIKTGDRVVVTYVEEKDDRGKAILVAREVRLGTPPKESVS
jgi:hypothetical protein